MECEEIKQIIPKYFQHTASEEEIQTVEEHLCLCHGCRTILGELMDKTSEAQEVAEASSQDQAEVHTDEKPQEEVEEKKEESVSASEAKETEEKRPEENPERSEGEEDIEYFPGEDLEASMDKVDDILGKSEPAKGDPGDKPEEVESIAQDKEEVKPELSPEEKVEEITEEKEEVSEPVVEKPAGEDSSFEVISDSSFVSKQEPPTESDIEAFGLKDFEPDLGEAKKPEEKVELPLEEEKIEEVTEEKEEVSEPVVEKPAEEDSSFEVISDSPSAPKEELPVESNTEALGAKDLEPAPEETKEPEEKVELPLEEKEVEETTEIKETTEEEIFVPPSENDIKLKEEKPEEPAPKQEDGAGSLGEGRESLESLEEVPYSLEGASLEKSSTGLLEYLCLAAGLGVLGFLAYLLLKG